MQKGEPRGPETAGGPLELMRASAQQQQIHWLDQLFPGQSLYNEARAYELPLEVDPERLERAVRQAVHRHEALRYRMLESGGAVSATVHADVSVLELCRLGVLEESVDEEVRRFVERPFSPASDLQVRAGLFTTDGLRVWVLCAHHSVVDGRAMDRLVADIASFYADDDVATPQIDSSYRAFVQQQLEFLQSPVLEHQLRWWTESLSGAPMTLRLSRRPSGARSHRGSQLRHRLDPRVESAVRASARQLGTTPFAVLLGMFGLVVRQRTGMRDFVLGTGASGRPAGFVDTVGMFANLLPVRLRPQEGQSLGAMVESATDRLFDARRRSRVPFDRILKVVPGARAVASLPLVQVVFTMWEGGFRPDFGGRAPAIPREVVRSRARYDLLFEWVVADGALSLWVEYDEGLFGADEVRELVDTLESWVLELERAPDRIPTLERDEPDSRPRLVDSSEDDQCADPAVSEWLAGAWARALGVSTVPLDAEFFAMGGHSLPAAQIVSAVRSELGVPLTLAEFFEHSQLGRMASLLERRLEEAQPGVPRAQDDVTDAPSRRFMLTELQLQIWIDEQFATSDMRDFSPSVVYRISGEFSVDALESALDGLSRRHELIRCRLDVRDGMPEFVSIDDATPDLRQFEAGVGERALEEAIVGICRAPFDLQTGPMLRIRWARVGLAEHVLVLVQHHLLTDATSMRILIRELGALYRREVQGGPALPHPPPPRWSRVVATQRERLAGERAQSTLDWWTEHLRGAVLIPDLPGRDATSVRSSATACHRATVHPSVSQAITVFCALVGCTPFAVMLTAWARVLCEWAELDEIVVGTNVETRSLDEDATTLGCFSNPVALRLQTGPESWEYRARAVQEQINLARKHGWIPFRRVVRALGQHPRPGTMPLAVHADWVPARVPPLEVPPASVQGRVVPLSTNRYHLSMYGCRTEDGRLMFELEYAVSVWDADLIGLHFQRFMVELQQLVGEGDA